LHSGQEIADVIFAIGILVLLSYVFNLLRHLVRFHATALVAAHQMIEQEPRTDQDREEEDQL
jgi:hypothetical protein